MQKLKIPLTLQLSHLRQAQEIEIQSCQCQPTQVKDPTLFQRLTVLSQSSSIPFKSSFVRNYLLVKLNNLARFGGQPYRHFLTHLAMYHNQLVKHPKTYLFKQGYSGKQLMAQILLLSGTYLYLTSKQIQEVLESNGFIVTTLAQAYDLTQNLLQKSELVLSLGLTSLFARSNPFIPIVHKDKNHAGQCRFASNIFEKLQLNPQIQKPNLQIIQDAYSLRCTPQVHGVVYDLFTQIEATLTKSLNKPQSRQITINGCTVRNLMFKEECETTLLDSLVCGLNQIGHMSFLRTQRMLNKYLTHNKIAQSPFYSILMTKLKKVSLLVVHNKKLASPTNADTVILDNYTHDIFVDEASPFTKVNQMISNLKQLLKLELSTAIEVLNGLYGQHKNVFSNQKMHDLFSQLSEKRKNGYQPLVQGIDQWIA